MKKVYYDSDSKEWLGAGLKQPFRLFVPLATISFTLFTLPEGLAYVSSLSPLRTIWWAALFLNCAILATVFLSQSLRGYGKRIDSVIAFSILALFPICVFTLFNSEGSYIQLLRRCVYIIGPWLYLAVFGNYGFKPLLKAMLAGSIFIILANALSIVVMYSHGSFRPEYQDTWLFGQRTFMRNFIFPGLFFSILNDRRLGKRVSFCTVTIIVAALFSFVVGDAMTSLAVFCLVLFLLILPSKRIRQISIFRYILLCSVSLDILLVHVRNIEMFRGIIEGVFNRNITLSYRTQAWDIAIEQISRQPLYGVGITDLESSVLVVGYGKQLSNVHNQLLDVWFKGGAFSLAFFIVLIARCISPLLASSKKWATYITGIFVGAFIIEAIVSEVWYPQFFLLLYISAYIANWADLFERKVQ